MTFWKMTKKRKKTRKRKMSKKKTALEVMRIALQQYHVVESPAGSNCVKYNTAYYGHAVRGDKYP